MKCKNVEDWLDGYHLGELPPVLQGEVDAHLAECPECRYELSSLARLASELRVTRDVAVPPSLWPSIERRLNERLVAPRTRWRPRSLGRPLAAAASLLLVVGLGLSALVLLGDGASEAEAANVDFSTLLDALPLDAHKAFRKFLTRYHARDSSPHEARLHAPNLSFGLPDALPGGFRLGSVYVLRFGTNPGVAAEYWRDGEFLGAVFHPPVQKEDFGTHKDYPCVIGKHRGHKVEVGDWKLVHVTDPTTCHCVLSRLDEVTELPGVLSAVAPGSNANAKHGRSSTEH